MSDHDDIRAEFREAVNMTPGELSKWLKSGESKSVGVTPSGPGAKAWRIRGGVTR